MTENAVPYAPPASHLEKAINTLADRIDAALKMAYLVEKTLTKQEHPEDPGRTILESVNLENDIVQNIDIMSNAVSDLCGQLQCIHADVAETLGAKKLY